MSSPLTISKRGFVRPGEMQPRDPSVPVQDVIGMGDEEIESLSTQELADSLGFIAKQMADFRKKNAIRFYEPVSDLAAKAHESTAKVLAMFGGNGSSKTETVIAEIVMLATGIMPDSFRTNPKFRQKFRGPIAVRIVVESLINTLWPIILPKFQWFTWTGVSEPGGPMGHWGWIPESSLKGGKWEKAFSKELRQITMLCRDPDTGNILGESTISFMSKDNDPEDFASGDFDIVMEDEPPKEAIHRENQARTMRKDGRIILAMTWPDDPTIPVSWIYDEIYEKGAPGPSKSPLVDWFQLDTRDNKHLRQDSIRDQISMWSKEQYAVRILGQPIRFSHRVHPLFRDDTRNCYWCFNCSEECYAEESEANEVSCHKCQSKKVTKFGHVFDEAIPSGWPVVFAIDPHPRKPHMMAWIAVRPSSEDYYQVAELSCDDEAEEVARQAKDVEREYKLNVCRRIIDPNMGQSAPGAQRRVTWKKLFSDVGLNCELADDSQTGQDTINAWLKPDPDTLEPRMGIHPRCIETVKQFNRYTWDNYRVGAERGLKETPKPIDDDFPTLWKYFANEATGGRLDFRSLRMGPQILRRRGRNRRG
jgi:hypothetical protein